MSREHVRRGRRGRGLVQEQHGGVQYRREPDIAVGNRPAETRETMRTYLRIINPLVSVIVLALCFYAATVEKGTFDPDLVVGGGIPTYFVAKGLFCSSALFILGRVLLNMLDRAEGRNGREPLPEPRDKRDR
jgi:hypothetical protein